MRLLTRRIQRPYSSHTGPAPYCQFCHKALTTMSVAELPPRVAQPPATIAIPTDRPAGLTITYEQVVYIGLFILALLTHLWGLGDRALHHDETLHAAFSWRLYMNQGFLHDPLLHGPFLYHIVALMYFLFGDSDFTARLSVALFGSALVVMPYLIRRELGHGAALIAAVYLLISPAYLYMGRFIRHDMFSVVFELLTIISMVRYASTRQSRWLYIGAAALRHPTTRSCIRRGHCWACRRWRPPIIVMRYASAISTTIIWAFISLSWDSSFCTRRFCSPSRRCWVGLPHC